MALWALVAFAILLIAKYWRVMKKILFVCHGNICRSPMAEFVMKHLCKNAGLDDVLIDSRATHTDELGSSPHNGTITTLMHHNIKLCEHKATLLERSDYDKYELILCMDRANLHNCELIFGKRADFSSKVRLLLSICGENKEVADPYYTLDFERTYSDIMRACEALLAQIRG